MVRWTDVAGLGLLLLGVVFSTIAIPTEEWSTYGGATLGLWRVCPATGGCSDVDDTDELDAVRAMMLMGDIVALLAVVIMLLAFVLSAAKDIASRWTRVVVAAAVLLAAMLTLAGVIVYQAEIHDDIPTSSDRDKGYSFWFAIVALILFLLSTAVFILGAVIEERARRQSRREMEDSREKFFEKEITLWENGHPDDRDRLDRNNRIYTNVDDYQNNLKHNGGVGNGFTPRARLDNNPANGFTPRARLDNPANGFTPRARLDNHPANGVTPRARLENHNNPNRRRHRSSSPKRRNDGGNKKNDFTRGRYHLPHDVPRLVPVVAAAVPAAVLPDSGYRYNLPPVGVYPQLEPVGPAGYVSFVGVRPDRGGGGGGHHRRSASGGGGGGGRPGGAHPFEDWRRHQWVAGQGYKPYSDPYLYY